MTIWYTCEILSFQIQREKYIFHLKFTKRAWRYMNVNFASHRMCDWIERKGICVNHYTNSSTNEIFSYYQDNLFEEQKKSYYPTNSRRRILKLNLNTALIHTPEIPLCNTILFRCRPTVQLNKHTYVHVTKLNHFIYSAITREQMCYDIEAREWSDSQMQFPNK